MILRALLLVLSTSGSAVPEATPATAAIVLPDAAPEDPRLSDPAVIGTHREGTVLLGSGIAPDPMRARASQLPSAMKMVAVPAGCFALGAGTWSGMSAHTGDAATPLLEMGSGFAGGWGAAMATGAALYVISPKSFVFRQDRVLGGALVPSLVIGTVVPFAAGGATFFAQEYLEGRGRHRDEIFWSAVAGAAAGELLLAGSSAYFKTPDGVTSLTLAFVPVAAGAALGARIARGSSGRDRPLVRAPIQVFVRF